MGVLVGQEAAGSTETGANKELVRPDNLQADLLELGKWGVGEVRIAHSPFHFFQKLYQL